MRRRYYSGNFTTRYFRGRGIDIGPGPDCISQYMQQFPLIEAVLPFDMEHGNAQFLTKYIPKESVDFIHSSHSLEHMVDPYLAIREWALCLKLNGYLIITVPDEDLYEQGVWPSQRNFDHKTSWTIHKKSSSMPKSINCIDIIKSIDDLCVCEKIELITDFWDPRAKGDQTQEPNPECAIEIILRKIV